MMNSLSLVVALDWFPSESKGVTDRTMSLLVASTNESGPGGMSSCLGLFGSVWTPGLLLPRFAAGLALPGGWVELDLAAGLSSSHFAAVSTLPAVWTTLGFATGLFVPRFVAGSTLRWFGLNFLGSVARGPST